MLAVDGFRYTLLLLMGCWPNYLSVSSLFTTVRLPSEILVLAQGSQRRMPAAYTSLNTEGDVIFININCNILLHSLIHI